MGIYNIRFKGVPMQMRRVKLKKQNKPIRQMQKHQERPNQQFGSFLKSRSELVSSATPKGLEAKKVDDHSILKNPSQHLARSRTVSMRKLYHRQSL